MIVLESDEEYLAYTLFEKEVELEKLQAKVNILNNSIVYLFFRKKEDLTRALEDKLSMSEKKLAHSSSIVNQMMIGLQKLNEIISSTILLVIRERLDLKKMCQHLHVIFPSLSCLPSQTLS